MWAASGGWQILRRIASRLECDCVVEGRSESTETLDLFRKADSSGGLPRRVMLSIRWNREGILFPTPQYFGVVEMTRLVDGAASFACRTDPQIDLPKTRLMDAVRANIRDGNKQNPWRLRHSSGAGAHRHTFYSLIAKRGWPLLDNRQYAGVERMFSVTAQSAPRV